MNRVVKSKVVVRHVGFALTLGLIALLCGCVELNQTVDGLLGKSSPVLSSAQGLSHSFLIPVKNQPAGRPGKKPAAQKQDKKPAEPKIKLPLMGKRREPGVPPPARLVAGTVGKTTFDVERDPFKPPTEILPSECPPSMPLCRFDRSQLKLVGVIQISQGQFKGMVEDPDGRGYFVLPGMQIGSATITQVTRNGLTLFDHNTREDVPMPLYSENKERGNF